MGLGCINIRDVGRRGKIKICKFVMYDLLLLFFRSHHFLEMMRKKYSILLLMMLCGTQGFSLQKQFLS